MVKRNKLTNTTILPKMFRNKHTQDFLLEEQNFQGLKPENQKIHLLYPNLYL